MGTPPLHCQGWTNPLREEIFPIIQPKPPLAHLESRDLLLLLLFSCEELSCCLIHTCEGFLRSRSFPCQPWFQGPLNGANFCCTRECSWGCIFCMVKEIPAQALGLIKLLAENLLCRAEGHRHHNAASSLLWSLGRGHVYWCVFFFLILAYFFMSALFFLL